MLDVKTWLETTGMKATEVSFKKPPPLPYIIILESEDVRGADTKNLIRDRDITIELYSDKIDKEAEQKIENLLNEKSIEYKKDRAWLESGRFFQTMYDFNLLEKL